MWRNKWLCETTTGVHWEEVGRRHCKCWSMLTSSPDLMAGLKQKGHDLYTDNYYTSPQLFQCLYDKGINSCWTARPNRKHFSKELVQKKKQHKRGFHDYHSNGSLLAVRWTDNRYIYFVTTLHRAEMAADDPVTLKRRQADGTRIDVECPPLLPDCQAFMRGVDRSDQMICFYNIGKRSKKWWKWVFSHIVECAILNTYILDSHIHPLEHALRGRKKWDYLSFQLQLAEELIGSLTSHKRAGRRWSGEHTYTQRLAPEFGHWPQESPTSQCCVVCSAKK